MSNTNCLVVRAHGTQLDQLRGEASRISRGHKVDWWVERGEKAARFCFENAESRKAFALMPTPTSSATAGVATVPMRAAANAYFFILSVSLSIAQKRTL